MPAIRAAAVALALVAAVAVARAAPPPATGFDHVRHDGKVTVTGVDAIPCAACHVPGPRGAVGARPDHAACFGACHGPRPTRAAPGLTGREAVCGACHAPDALATPRPGVAYPPYRLDPDYGLAFRHDHHAAITCAACHAVPGAPPRRTVPHARCTGCHLAAAAPAMTACETCHQAGSGVNLSPRLVRGPLAVGATYDHLRHQRRAPAAPLACPTCHRGVATAPGLELAPPAVATCAVAGCHDGAGAFAATIACTRCHTAAPTGEFAVARPTARYSHLDHAAVTMGVGCTACHAVAAGGEAVSVGHAACETGACHAGEMAARQPTICGACHASTEPWRHLTVDQAPAPRSEFGAALSHARHAAVACTRCHQHDTATTELRPPRGHAACVGSGCHAASGGPAPAMAACAQCHEPGLAAERVRVRLDASWSVRARFRHAPHRDTPGGCVACHADVPLAGTIAAIAGPAKATCAPCHDGARAFRMTGHGCARCHGR